MGKKIAKCIGLIILAIVLPIIIGVTIFLGGVLDMIKVVLPILLIGVITIIVTIKAKKWILSCYILGLTLISIVSSIYVVDLTNIFFYDAKGGLDGRIERINKVSETKGMYLYELISKNYIRTNTASYKNKVIRDEKTFHYKDEKEPTESIEFFLNTINKYKDKFNDYLIYNEDYPIDIYYQRGMKEPPAFTTPIFIKIGYYDEYLDMGLDERRGLTKWYEEAIVHEYIHAIMNSMMYKEEEKMNFINDGIKVEDDIDLKAIQDNIIPSWFAEGLAEHCTYEILGKEFPRYEIEAVDLKAGRLGNEQVLNKFYTASGMVVREVYKEVGKSGIIKIISETKAKGFDKVFTEVTGKILEDYYYILKNNSN